MTLPAQRSPRPSAYGIAPPLLLAAVLVAVAVLFVQSWNRVDEQRAFAERERQGVEYLRSLNQVTMALVDVQTATVAGRTASRETLNQAVEATTSVDARLGDELRTRERWAGVRAKIEALPDRGLNNPEEINDAYGETAALLLALYGKVRESSGLIRDPDADTYHLQDSAAEELPEALIAAGHLTDLASLATTRGADDQIRTATEFSTARSAVLEPVEDLVQGLQAAVDGTDSRQLSGNLLRHVDPYQQAVEALTGASAAGGANGPNPERVESARKAMQKAAADLAEVMLTELDGLVETRLDGLTGERRLTGVTAATGLLLGLALAYLLLTPGRRRAPKHPAPVDPGRSSPGEDVGGGPDPWEQSRGWAEPAAAHPFGPAPAAAHPFGPAPAATTAAPATASTGPVHPAGIAGSQDQLGGQPAAGSRSDRPTRWGWSDAAR